MINKKRSSECLSPPSRGSTICNNNWPQLITSNTDQADLNIQIAQIFRERAELAETQHHLLALPLWFDALKYYTDARKRIDHPVAALGVLRCMIMLGRYARAENTLNE